MSVLEISDLVVAWDPVTGERLPVRRADVVARLREAGDRRAARIVDRMPATGEFLDPAAVDLLLVRVHTELQRLNEELHMAQRFAEILLPMITAVRTSRIIPRVVDIGCGLGFLVRSLAATGVLGDDVELVGVDFNPTLIAEATRLAADEHLRCTFARADAFTLAEPATVYLSSGVLPGPGPCWRTGVHPLRHRRDPPGPAGRLALPPGPDAGAAGSPRRCDVRTACAQRLGAAVRRGGR